MHVVTRALAFHSQLIVINPVSSSKCVLSCSESTWCQEKSTTFPGFPDTLTVFSWCSTWQMDSASPSRLASRAMSL